MRTDIVAILWSEPRPSDNGEFPHSGSTLKRASRSFSQMAVHGALVARVCPLQRRWHSLLIRGRSFLKGPRWLVLTSRKSLEVLAMSYQQARRQARCEEWEDLVSRMSVFRDLATIGHLPSVDEAPVFCEASQLA
jgi:hypothetical protein